MGPLRRYIGGTLDNLGHDPLLMLGLGLITNEGRLSPGAMSAAVQGAQVGQQKRQFRAKQKQLEAARKKKEREQKAVQSALAKYLDYGTDRVTGYKVEDLAKSVLPMGPEGQARQADPMEVAAIYTQGGAGHQMKAADMLNAAFAGRMRRDQAMDVARLKAEAKAKSDALNADAKSVLHPSKKLKDLSPVEERAEAFYTLQLAGGKFKDTKMNRLTVSNAFQSSTVAKPNVITAGETAFPLEHPEQILRRKLTGQGGDMSGLSALGVKPGQPIGKPASEQQSRLEFTATGMANAAGRLEEMELAGVDPASWQTYVARNFEDLGEGFLRATSMLGLTSAQKAEMGIRYAQASQEWANDLLRNLSGSAINTQERREEIRKNFGSLFSSPEIQAEKAVRRAELEIDTWEQLLRAKHYGVMGVEKMTQRLEAAKARLPRAKARLRVAKGGTPRASEPTIYDTMTDDEVTRTAPKIEDMSAEEFLEGP